MAKPSAGIIYVGPTHRPVRDLAAPGEYNFRRALKLSKKKPRSSAAS